MWFKWCLSARFHLTSVVVKVSKAILFIGRTRTIALYHITLWGNFATVLGTPWSRQFTYLMSLSVAKHLLLFKRLMLFILNKVLRDSKTHFSWLLRVCVTEFWIVYICLWGIGNDGIRFVKFWQIMAESINSIESRKAQKYTDVLHLYHSASQSYCICSQVKDKDCLFQNSIVLNTSTGGEPSKDCLL